MRDMKEWRRYFAAIDPAGCRRALEKAHAIGRKPPLGESNPLAKLSADAVAEIRLLKGSGLRQVDIAARYGVDQTTISRVLRGVAWRGIG
jgi:predicted DNA-binding protein (UPF0251 family)